MAVQVERQLFTVEEYYRMAEVGILKPSDRFELIKGEIYKMSPINSQHAGHVIRLNTLLNKLLSDKAIISIQNPIHINNFSEPEPDIAVLKPVDHYYIERHPKPEDVLLIIEIAGTSLRYDRQVKLPLYAEAGIPEVWILNLSENVIEIYRNPVDYSYQTTQVVKSGEKIDMPWGLYLEVKDIIG